MCHILLQIVFDAHCFHTSDSHWKLFWCRSFQTQGSVLRLPFHGHMLVYLEAAKKCRSGVTLPLKIYVLSTFGSSWAHSGSVSDISCISAGLDHLWGSKSFCLARRLSAASLLMLHIDLRLGVSQKPSVCLCSHLDWVCRLKIWWVMQCTVLHLQRSMSKSNIKNFRFCGLKL